MFSRRVNATKFTDPIGLEFFCEVKARSIYDGDQAPVAVMAALLHDRLQGSGRVFDFCYLYKEFRSASEGAITDMLHSASVNCEKDSLVFMDVYGDPEVINQVFEAIDNEQSGFIAKNEGYKRTDDIEKYIASTVTTRIFVNRERECAVVFINRMNARTYHLMCSFIPRYFPKLFSEKPVSPEEIAMLGALTKNDYHSFFSKLNFIADRYDLRDFKIKKLLEGFSQRTVRQRIDSLRSKIADNDRQIADNLRYYKSLLEAREELNISLIGLKTKANMESRDAELIEYLQANKNVTLLSAEDYSIEILVSTTIESFDDEMFEAMIGNEDSDINYEGFESESGFDVEDRAKLLRALFSSEATLKVKTCAYYSLETRGSVETRSDYGFPYEFRDRVPNPHLNYHACLGDYRRYIQDCLEKQDIVAAIEQCVASARSVNIGESVTFEPFVREILRSENKIIVLPNGTDATPHEALEYLNSTSFDQ